MTFVFAACAGIALIAAILWEVFDDLFRPGGSGALSDWIGRRLFNLCRRIPHALPLAGPLAVVSVIAAWVAGLILGFALIYVGSYPDSFRTSTARIPPAAAPFRAVVYYSFQTLVTLAYGDLVPQSFAMRMTSSIEGLFGFGVLTASVSSIVLLYPALSRLRLLARGVSNIVAAEERTGIRMSESGSDTLLAGLARDVTHTRIDLVHFPIVYYFTTYDPDGSLARWTGHLSRIAAEAAESDRPANVRLAGLALDEALNDLSKLIARRFVHDVSPDDRRAVFAAFSNDHAVEIA